MLTGEKILEALYDFQLDDQHIKVQFLLIAHIAENSCDLVFYMDIIPIHHLFESVDEAVVLEQEVDVLEIAGCDVTQTQTGLSPYDN